MVDNLHDYSVNGQVYWWDTFFGSGGPTNMVGATATVYKGGNDTESNAGLTLTMPYDGRTGFIRIAINLSADSTFYAAGSDFTCILTAGTLDGVPQTPRTLFRFSVGRTASLSELVTELVGPAVTVVSDGSNTPLTFKVAVTGVTDNTANWWKRAWLSFDLTSNLAGQTGKITSFNQTTEFVTMDEAFTAIPGVGTTARLVTR